jgi:hypothetical protein
MKLGFGKLGGGSPDFANGPVNSSEAAFVRPA